jgi:class 3 adenylate cyclase/tetratricopeptide (TPR) repeat protein
VNVSNTRLDAYVPRIATGWDGAVGDALWQPIDGSLVFVDISGFTNLSERLARKGRIGAEELTSVLNRVFGRMLEVVYERGGSLLKFGGDALLLLFSTEDHVMQACAATVEMRSELRSASQEPTSVGRIDLKMSSGIHTGSVDFFLVGESHRELIVTGPAASVTTQMEGTADAGEIVVSDQVKTLVPGDFIGDRKGDGWLLRKRRITHPACGLQTRESPPDDDVSRFVPSGLREHLGARIEDSEHRIATIAFIKFKGTDAMLDEGDPERVGKELDTLIGTVQQAADSEGVTFLASDIDADGGKIILAGGVPSSRHDDEGRVLRAARRILDADLELTLRIGVNRGHVFSGNVGTDFRRTYTVMGDTVNLAARLMAAADAGMLYAAPSVLNLSSTLFRTKPLEAFHVKGKEHPVQAFAVFEETGVRPPEIESDLPFRGRDAELEMLVGIVNTCSRVGRGGIMTITGDTGVGKSRLIAEVLERCSGMDTLMIQAEPSGVDNPYWAFRDPLRRFLGIERASQQDMADRLTAVISDRAKDVAWALPLVGDVLHIDVEDNEATAQIDPQFRPDRTADVLIEILSAGYTRPVALIAEDGQWLDEVSLRLLDRIGKAATEHPWTVLVTARDSDGEFASMGDEIVLRPLDDGDVRSIAIEVTQAAPLRPHELEAVVTKADGNPLFLGEILRVISETGSAEQLPDSLDAVVSTEIDSLSPLPRQVLRYASVLGRRFRRPVLQEFLAPEEIALDDATVNDLGRFIDDEGEDRLAFRHSVVYEIAYESLPYGKRRELHARAGDVIERQAGDDPESVAEYLATHYSLSERHDKAWHYSLLAGEKAKNAYANAEATAHYRRALDAARFLGVPSENRADVYQAMGDVLDRLGEFDEARLAYQRAFRLYDDPESQANVLWVSASMLKRTGKLTQALRTQTRGLRLTEEHELWEVAVDLYAERASVRHYQGKYAQAIELAERAINLSGDQISAAVALAELTADNARTVHEASTDHSGTRRALNIAEQLGDSRLQGSALNNLGMYAYYDGDWEAASAMYGRATDAFLKTGHEIAAAFGVANTAEIKSEQGYWNEAEASFSDALRVFRSAGETFMMIFVLTHLGRIASNRGQTVEALARFDEALALAVERGASTEQVELGLRKAETLLAGGRVEEALVELDKSDLSPGRVPVQLRPLAHRAAGLAAIAQGSQDNGLAELQLSLESARETRSGVDELHAIHAISVIRPRQDLIDRAFELTQRLGIIAVPTAPVVLRH